MTYNELLQKLNKVNLKKGGKVPGYKQLLTYNSKTLLKQTLKTTYSSEIQIVAYECGYVHYSEVHGDKRYHTVFETDTDMTYDFVDKPYTINRDVYKDLDAVEVLMLIGSDRIEHNRMSREDKKTAYHLDNDGNDFTEEAYSPNFTDSHFLDYDEEPDLLYSKRLSNALFHISPKQAEVIYLYYNYRYTQQEIADILGIKRSSVEDRLHNAYKKLKKLLMDKLK